MNEYEPMDEMINETPTVGDVMVSKVIFTDPDLIIQKAAQKMHNEGIGSLIVKHDNDIKGIVTKEDIVYEYVAQDKGKKVEDIMTKNLITISPDKNIEDAAFLMAKKEIERLPVMDDGKIIGIISTQELMKVQPDLYLDLLEALKFGPEEFTRRSIDTEIGSCDSCGNFSENLEEVEGQMICEICRDEL